MLRPFLFVLLLIGGLHDLSAQTDTVAVSAELDGPVGAVGLAISDLGLLTADLLSSEESGEYFDALDGWRPSVTLMRMDSTWLSLLSLSMLIRRDLSTVEVPLLDVQLMPLGPTSLDRSRWSSLVLDMEVGKHRIWYLDKWHFMAGPSLFVSYGRYEEQFETDNPLEAYIGRVFNLTTRSRMITGLRARVAFGRRLADKWAVDVSASYQAGLRFSPEVTSLVASQGDLTTVGLSRRVVREASTESFSAETVVPSIRLVYLIR